jgi:hypothetical protein
MITDEICPICGQGNGAHLAGCALKPRIGRPAFDDGYERWTIYIRGTQAEHDAVLDGLSARQRMEAMLDKIAANSADPDWMPPPIYACTCGKGVEVHPTQHAESCDVYAPF